MRRAVVRILVILTLSLGVNYVVWRWFALGELVGLVDRGPTGGGRDLQPHRRLPLRRDHVADQGARRAAAPRPAGDRRRVRRHLQRAHRPRDDHRPRGGRDPVPAPDLGARRRRPPRDAGGGARRGHRLHPALRGLGEHAAPREGRQPQHRALRHRGRVPAHPGRRPGPRADDPGPGAGLLPRPAGRGGADPAVLQRQRLRPARQPGARCSTARSRRARTAGTRPSSAAPTPCCAARR